MSIQDLPESKKWKYAKQELERRFLLKGQPESTKNPLSKIIKDNYLHQTRLRVRKVSNENGAIYKLSKKVLLQKENAKVQWISTIYLGAMEYELLQSLSGERIEKQRFYYPQESGETIGVDQIIINDKTIWLAEVEFESEATMNAYLFPFEYEREVSNDLEYSGYELAKQYQQANF